MKAKWKYVIAAFALVWLAFFVYTLSKPERKAVVDARLPQSTIDYFKRLKDQIIVINPNPNIDDWINDKAGTEKVREYSSIENDNFIIYFLPNTKSENRAPEVLSYANAAIKPLEQLMDRYYYPSMVNNRKLPIFITNSRKEYDNIINRLLENWGKGGGNSTGITLLETSSLGMRTIAIVLSDRAWDLKIDSEYPRQVVWHEMNHYVYFTALQTDLPEMPPEWFTEGIAEYFAQSSCREKEISPRKARQVDLSKELKNSYDKYWVGYSVFTFMDDRYGKHKVRRCIKKSYNNIVEEVFVSELNTTLTNFNYQWREYVNYNY